MTRRRHAPVTSASRRFRGGHSEYERAGGRVLCRLLAMEDGEVPKKFDPEVKARAVRMIRDHLSTYGSVTATAAVVGPQLGISENTLRRWVSQAEVDAGQRDGLPSAVQVELVRLTAENKRLRGTPRSCAGEAVARMGRVPAGVV